MVFKACTETFNLHQDSSQSVVMGQHVQNTMIFLKPFSDIGYILTRDKWTKWAAGRLILLREKHLCFLEVTGVEVAGRYVLTSLLLVYLEEAGPARGPGRAAPLSLQHSPGCCEKQRH